MNRNVIPLHRGCVQGARCEIIHIPSRTEHLAPVSPLNRGERTELFFRMNGDLLVGICIGIALGCFGTVGAAYAISFWIN